MLNDLENNFSTSIGCWQNKQFNEVCGGGYDIYLLETEFTMQLKAVCEQSNNTITIRGDGDTLHSLMIRVGYELRKVEGQTNVTTSIQL